MPPKKAKKGLLQDLLKKQIKKGRLKIPDPDPPHPSRSDRNHFAFEPSTASASTSKLTRPSHLYENADETGDTGDLFEEQLVDTMDQDVDSLFGDPLDTPTIREQEKQAHRERFLSAGTPTAPIPRFTESQILQDLRSELKATVMVEADGISSSRERALLARQKNPLIEEIRYMEDRERSNFEEKQAKNKDLPEPLSRGEKRQLEWKRKREEKAKALPLQHPSRQTRKRTREEIEDDDDLDGEERLRRGMRIRRDPPERIARFRTPRPY